MRCEKCGNEVADNIPFCPFCGEKITQEISVYEEKRGQVGRTVRDNVDNNDRVFNDRLFSVYNGLLEPVEKIESIYRGENLLKTEIAECSVGFNPSHSLLELLIDSIRYIIVYGIIFLILVLFSDGKAEEWMVSGVLPFRIIAAPVWAAYTIMDLIYDLLNGLFGLEWNTIFSIITAVVAVLLPGILVVILIWLVISIVPDTVSFIRRRSRIPKLEQQLKETHDELISAVEDVRLYIQFVPPEYRFSDALKYFTRAYRTGQAGNLKEAIKEYEHHADIEQLREEIRQMREAICAELREIRYSIDEMNATLNDMDSKLGSIKSTVDSIHFRLL